MEYFNGFIRIRIYFDSQSLYVYTLLIIIRSIQGIIYERGYFYPCANCVSKAINQSIHYNWRYWFALDREFGNIVLAAINNPLCWENKTEHNVLIFAEIASDALELHKQMHSSWNDLCR